VGAASEEQHADRPEGEQQGAQQHGVSAELRGSLDKEPPSPCDGADDVGPLTERSDEVDGESDRSPQRAAADDRCDEEDHEAIRRDGCFE
jgi:hypothetical protein